MTENKTGRSAGSRKPEHHARWFWVAMASAVGLAALAAWYYGGGADAPVYADARDAALVATGRQVYDENCASCHGANLEGQPEWRSRLPDGTFPAPPHDETGHTWHHPDGQLFEIIKFGGQAAAPAGFKSGMPGFADTLSDREILASLAYIKSRWPARIRTRQDQVTQQSANR